MGIDAEILIRNVSRDIVTDEWLKKTSWLLCEAIGAKHFFLDAEDGRMAIERTLSRYREDGDPAPGSTYHQDGDSIHALPGECLLRLNIWGRYYGPGYERGNLLVYCGMAEWLEMNIPGCEVWYGGDSSGVCAEPFTRTARENLKRHLYSEKGRAYFNHESWDLLNTSDGIQAPPACAICPSSKYMGSRCGWGQGYAKFHCAGCGKSTSTRDSGLTWGTEKEE